MNSRPPRRPQRDALRVHVVAPSSPFAPDALARGVERLQSAGLEVAPTDDVLAAGHAYLNGDDAHRVERLHAALHDDVDVVWLARGGYGLTRIVDQIVAPPDGGPVVVGFSDSTALHARLLRQGFRSVHGPLATTLHGEPPESFAQTLSLLRGERPAPVKLHRVLGDGAVDGPVFCANLCVLTHLIGTDVMPDLRGHLLVLEEVGERPYRIDRMLTHLRAAGALDEVAGVVLGHLTGCDDAPRKNGRPPSPRAVDVVAERLQALSVPVARGLPCGHEAPNHSFVQGAWASLHVAGDDAELRFDQGLYDPPTRAVA